MDQSYGVRLTGHNWRIFTPTMKVFRSAVKDLVSIVLENYDDIEGMTSNQAQTYIKNLVHSTRTNNAKYHFFDKKYYKYPSEFLKSTITTAIGIVSSYKELYKSWDENGRKGKAPRLNTNHNVFPCLFHRDMFKSDIKYIHEQFEQYGIKEKAPVLVKRMHKYELRFQYVTATGLPVLKYVSSNIGKNESKLLRVCAVDLGVDNDAVCSIIKYDGTVTARKFIRFAVEKDRMYKILEQIKKNQQNGNLRTPRLWRFVDNYNQAISTKTATEIIDFALLYSAQVIVMEHLEFKGKKSGSKKQRLHLWRKKEILNRVTDLAHKYNMRVSTVNPRNTSKLAYDGSGFVMRGINGKYSVCMFMTGKIYNCDLSASYNIGARYLIREFLKTVSSNIEEQLRAKVPEAFKRTLCTLSTLISLRATAESLGLVC